MESPTEFSQVPAPQMVLPRILLQKLFLLLPTHYFFIRTLKKIENQIHNLPSRDPRPQNLLSHLLSIRPPM